MVVVPLVLFDPAQDTVQSGMCAVRGDVPVRLCFQGVTPISRKLSRRKSSHFLTGKSVSRTSTVLVGVVDCGIGSGVVPKIPPIEVGTGLGGVCGIVGFCRGRGL